jgi:hypothetical protein
MARDFYVYRVWKRDGARCLQKATHAAKNLKTYAVEEEVRQASEEEIREFLEHGLSLETPLSYYTIYEAPALEEKLCELSA